MPAVRIQAADAPPTTAIPQAVAMSRGTFADGSAPLAVLARDDAFPDALAGSSLSFGTGPILFTSPTGPLDPATAEELERVLEPGAVVYLLGGEAAVPAGVADELRARGLEPRRLSGASREATAVAVAREVLSRGDAPDRPRQGTVVLATAGAWPDAVVAGQLGAWWGFPILLTPAEVLHPEVAALLEGLVVDRVLVVGGRSAVGEEVVAALGEIVDGAQILRLSGSDRIETADTVASWHVGELQRRGLDPPGTVVAANLRRDDGYAHALSAAPLLGATAGVLLPVEGVDGTVIAEGTRTTFCGVPGQPIIAGGPDVVAPEAAAAVTDLVAGVGCTSRDVRGTRGADATPGPAAS